MAEDDVLLRRIEALGAEAAKARAERDEAVAAMVQAREIRRDTLSDADLWKCSIGMGDHTSLLVKIWNRARDAEREARALREAMQKVEDYHRDRAAEIWAASRDDITDERNRESGIAWCVHAQAAYDIKYLLLPAKASIGGDHG